MQIEVILPREGSPDFNTSEVFRSPRMIAKSFRIEVFVVFSSHFLIKFKVIVVLGIHLAF
jgi:hypothetical protein